ncbi:MAG: hypothetical protein RIG27_23010 [Coleofasciculus sp. F4-SAH-05]
MPKNTKTKVKNSETLEQKLWKSADKLRKNIDAAEYPDTNELEILTQGMLNKHTLLDLIRHFTVFEQTKTIDPETEVVHLQTLKKISAYHQYYAVNKAVESVLQACGIPSPNPSQSRGFSKSGGIFKRKVNFFR